MANEYLKPQTPLKDLNSENYFYPLTTHDLIIVTLSRLSAFMNESDNLLNLTNIGTISSAGTVSFTGSLSVKGTATFLNLVYFKSHMHWPASINFTCDSVSANGLEWSFDLTSEDYTGTYWQVWSGKNSATILACYNDDRRVNIPVRLSIGGANNTSFSLSATSAFFSSTTRIQYNTPRFYLKDTNTAADTFAIMCFGNHSNDNGAYIYLNGPSRTGDGGANMFTIRNNVGDVRIDDHLIVTGSTDHLEWILINRSIYDLLLRFTSRGGYTSGWDSTQKIKYRSISSDYLGEMYYFGPRWKDTYATAGNANSSKTTAFLNTNYFQFREWSFNTNGTRTNYCEGYSLPNCDLARTAHAWYTIVTTKNPGALYWANVQCTASANTSTVPTFAAIELSGGSPYVDFHYNKSTADYTSRIIENASGRLYIPGKLAVAYTNDSYNLSCNSLAVNGNLFVNASNTSGKGIILSDDGDIVDLNNGYCSMRFTSGVLIYSANKGGSPNIELRSDGVQFNRNRTWGNKPSSGTTYFEPYLWWDLNNKRRGAVGSGFLSDGWAFTHILHQRTINSAETYTQLFLRIHDNGSRKIDVSAPLYGAVWNDYAEFRKGQMDNLKPGLVVTEVGNGEMKLANQKLQKGCKILSDTFGFALGETKECKLPIAVSGRVLVYCDTPKEELEPGDCLCANYNGNAIKMTGEEIIKYPDRIIGTVSEIPDYEIWHGGEYRPEIKNNPEDIVVNDRIWVYVR